MLLSFGVSGNHSFCCDIFSNYLDISDLAVRLILKLPLPIDSLNAPPTPAPKWHWYLLLCIYMIYIYFVIASVHSFFNTFFKSGIDKSLEWSTIPVCPRNNWETD